MAQKAYGVGVEYTKQCAAEMKRTQVFISIGACFRTMSLIEEQCTDLSLEIPALEDFVNAAKESHYDEIIKVLQLEEKNGNISNMEDAHIANEVLTVSMNNAVAKAYMALSLAENCLSPDSSTGRKIAAVQALATLRRDSICWFHQHTLKRIKIAEDSEMYTNALHAWDPAGVRYTKQEVDEVFWATFRRRVEKLRAEPFTSEPCEAGQVEKRDISYEMLKLRAILVEANK